jgi:hypothetical protein
MFRATAVALALVVSSAVLAVSAGDRGARQEAPQTAPVTPKMAQVPAGRLEVPPPPFTEGIFPCSTCHKELPVNRARRELFAHTEIVLKHDEEHRWCLDCHDPANRDFLHLANGDRVPFDTSYMLCGQCHGEKLRDWKAGVHGRRTGYWNGEKQYLLCVHCHSPHQPRFKPLEPKPAPLRPVRSGK